MEERTIYVLVKWWDGAISLRSANVTKTNDVQRDRLDGVKAVMKEVGLITAQDATPVAVAPSLNHVFTKLTMVPPAPPEITYELGDLYKEGN